MRIVRLSKRPYELPMPRALATAIVGVEVRRGTLIRVRDDAGREGWGDVVSWPGFGSGPAEVRLALTELDARTEGWSLDGCVSSASRLAADVGRVPEVAAALEQALLDLLAQRLGLPLHRILSDRRAEPVAVHLLVANVEQAVAAVRGGASALKIKAGSAQPEEDLRRVAGLREAVGPTVSLRVDANGAWDVPTAIRMAKALAELRVDWLEQPVPAAAFDGLAKVRRSAAIRVAADESVTGGAALDRLVGLEAVDGVTLKPVALGGLIATRTLARQADAAGLDVCLTHAFDSAIGRQGALHLAAALGLPGPHGLAPPFEADLAPVSAVVSGRVEVSAAPGLGVVPEGSRPPVPATNEAAS